MQFSCWEKPVISCTVLFDRGPTRSPTHIRKGTPRRLGGGFLLEREAIQDRLAKSESYFIEEMQNAGLKMNVYFFYFHPTEPEKYQQIVLKVVFERKTLPAFFFFLFFFFFFFFFFIRTNTF